jgi:hypothetical protein
MRCYQIGIVDEKDKNMTVIANIDGKNEAL